MKRRDVIGAFKKMRTDVSVTVEDLTGGETDVSRFYGVRVIPAFVLVGDAGEVVKRSNGPKTAEELSRFVPMDA